MTRPRDGGGLRIFVPTAIQALFARLAPRLEAAAGRSLVTMIDLNPAIARRILAGEPYDIALTNPPHVAALVAAGLADGASHRPFGRIPLAIGRRAGTVAPVLTEVQEIAALLRAADSIAYTGAGTSGQTFLAAMAGLGLAEAIGPKSRPMDGGGPVVAVASGEATLCVGPLTTIMASPGVTPAAILPAALGAHIDISAFLHPSRATGAAEVLDLLTGAELDAACSAAGAGRFKQSW